MLGFSKFRYVIALLLVIAVAPSSALAKKNIIVNDITINSEMSASAAKRVNKSVLSAELETAIRKSGKFAIYTRDKGSLQTIRNEQKLNKSSLASGTGAKEGKLQAADYVVMSEVQRLTLYRESKPVPNIENKFIRRDIGVMDMNIQIINASTGEIKASFMVNSKYYTKKKMVNTDNRTPSPNVFKQLSMRAAHKAVDELINTVFPMLVVGVTGDMVVVSRGKDGGLVKGMKLDAFATGEEMFDPYTNDSLGRLETYAATLQVIRVDPKTTTLRVVSGGPVQRMYIVRKKQ